MNSSVLIREERNEKEEVWAGKMLLLFRRFMKEKGESEKLAFARYMECVPYLGEAEEALKGVFL